MAGLPACSEPPGEALAAPAGGHEAAHSASLEDLPGPVGRGSGRDGNGDRSECPGPEQGGGGLDTVGQGQGDPVARSESESAQGTIAAPLSP